MSNFPLCASHRYETLSAAQVADGALVSSASSANVKGPYTTLGSTTFDWKGFHLNWATPSSVVNCTLDIAVSNSGSPTILLPDLFLDSSWGVIPSAGTLNLPLSVPKGAAVLARMQSEAANTTLRITMTGYNHDLEGTTPFAGIELGSLITSATTSLNSAYLATSTGAPVWNILASSTQRPWAGFFLMVGRANDGVRSPLRFEIDIGIGATGSERPIFTSIINLNDTGCINNLVFGPFPYNSPVSSQFNIRILETLIALPDSFGYAIYGIY